MKFCSVALSAVVLAGFMPAMLDTFTPTSLKPQRAVHAGKAQTPVPKATRTHASMWMASRNDDDYASEDDENFDDDSEMWERRKYGSPMIREYDMPSTTTPSAVLIDPSNPDIAVKPGASKYFPEEKWVDIVPDDELEQVMTPQEREENLGMIRQILKKDMVALDDRRDFAGMLEATRDVKEREKSDPWYGVNRRIREAYYLGEDEELERLKALAERLGGAPPGVEVDPRGYATLSEIHDTKSHDEGKINLFWRMRAEARARLFKKELKKSEEKQRKEREERLKDPFREERLGIQRRVEMMTQLRKASADETKKQLDSMKEMFGGTLPEMITTDRMDEYLDRVTEATRVQIRRSRRDFATKPLDTSKNYGRYRYDDDIMYLPVTPGMNINKKSSAQMAREKAEAEASGGRPRLPGDEDVELAELGDMVIESSSKAVTGPLTVEISSSHNREQSDPQMNKHCFQYNVRITNNSETETVQLLGRRFEIQTVGSRKKDIVEGEGVTGRQPVLKPGETFEYNSTAPLSVRPLLPTSIAARMRGEYRYVTLEDGQETATPEQIEQGGEAAKLGMFHFVFPENLRARPMARNYNYRDENDDDEEDDDKQPSRRALASPGKQTKLAVPASSIPGDDDMRTGEIGDKLNDSSDAVTDSIRVQVTSTYRPERSDASLEKHCFAYNIRITNESDKTVQLVSRRFEIQTVGSANKDVIQGKGVTGRQPILKPGESFEYTSTAPLSVKPMMEKTPAVARMQGDYNFVILGADSEPVSDETFAAKLGTFHFILPLGDA